MAKRIYKINQTSITAQLYLTILESIKKTGGLPKNLMSKSLLQYYVSLLKNEGKIKRIGYGVWEIIEPQTSITDTRVLPTGTRGLVSYGKPVPVELGDIRLHNLVFVVFVDGFVDWRALFDTRSVNYQVLDTGVVRVLFDGFKVWFVGDRVIIYVKPSVDFRAFKVGEALRLGLEWFYSFVPRLEAFIGFGLRSGGGLAWSVNRKHISIMRNALAVGYGSRGERLVVRDGVSVWLVTDRSKGFDELEFVRSSTNTGDSAKIEAFFNYVKANPNFPTEIKGVVNNLAMVQAQMVVKLKELFDFVNDRFGLER